MARRRSHRPASARGDLRAARVRPAVRVRRRAARAARCPRRCSSACATCGRRTSTRRCIATSTTRALMEQLMFELAPAEPPSFANFVAGPNAEAVTTLARAGARTRCARPGWSCGARRGRARRTCCRRRSRRRSPRSARRYILVDRVLRRRRRRPRRAGSRSTTSTAPIRRRTGAAVHAVQPLQATGAGSWSRRQRTARRLRAARRPAHPARLGPRLRARAARRRRQAGGARRAMRGSAASGWRDDVDRLPARARPPRHGDAASRRSRRSTAIRSRPSVRSRCRCCAKWLQREIALPRPPLG